MTEIQPLTLSPSESRYLEAMALLPSRDELLCRWAIPARLLGDMSGSNYSSARVELDLFLGI